MEILQVWHFYCFIANQKKNSLIQMGNVMPKNKCGWISLVMAAGLLCSMSAHAAPAYKITDLGNLGSNIISPRAINNSGTVVGGASTSSQLHAFYYANGNLASLGTLGGNSSQATDVNDNGATVGYSNTSSQGLNHAFLYQNGSMIDLTPTGSSGSAAGINNSGTVVGQNDGHAFIYQNGAMTDLGTLGGNYSGALDINENGAIVGQSGNSQGIKQAFLYENGSMISLGTFGGDEAQAEAINDNGGIVANSFSNSTFLYHAFYYGNGATINLGTLGGIYGSRGFDINNNGQIVGYSYNQLNQNRAFIYDNGIMTDLNDLLVDASGWTLLGAESINDSGQIVGVGTLNGVTHAYLLTLDTQQSSGSIPEPGTLALLGIALVGFRLKRKLN